MKYWMYLYSSDMYMDILLILMIFMFTHPYAKCLIMYANFFLREHADANKGVWKSLLDNNKCHCCFKMLKIN